MRPRHGISGLLLSLLLLFTQPLFSQVTADVTYKWDYQQIGECAVGSPNSNFQPIYEYNYYDINVSVGGGTNNADATTAYLVSPGGSYCPPNGPTGTLNIPVNPPAMNGASNNTDYIVSITATNSGSLSVVTNATTAFFPLYQVVSLLYAPPGNQSSQGLATATSYGTNTSVGESFENAQSVEADEGIKISGLTITGGGTTGWSTTNAFTEALTQTFTNASSYSNDLMGNTTWNPSKSNVQNHTLDTFLIWLNPEVYVAGSSVQGPTAFYLTGAPITGLANPVADIVMVAAAGMEEQAGSAGVASAGSTAVPVSTLEPIPRPEGGSSTGFAMTPGLAAACASNSLYQQQLAYDIANPTLANGECNSSGVCGTQYCTQANQCGCVADDFVTILEKDQLLDYHELPVAQGSTEINYAATPYPQTTNPVTIDSNPTNCGDNPIPSGTDCRYVVVPTCKGSGCITPVGIDLSGQGTGGAQYTDTNTATLTNTTTTTQSTGYSVSVGATPFFSLKFTDTWTWGISESTGNTTGTTNTNTVNIQTSTAGCTGSVALYEDTLYHTFAFQTEPTGCP